MSMSSNPPIRPIHPFPARMAPSIVWGHISRFARDTKRDILRVLDPMAGSGTTIATARMMGHEAIGFDTDPLAITIAQTWASDLDQPRLLSTAAKLLKVATQRAGRVTLRGAYPDGADEETKAFIRYWFDNKARVQLTVLASLIREETRKDIRQALWCGLSRTIIVKSHGVSRAMDVAHSRPHRVYDVAPVLPFDAFLESVIRIAGRAPFVDGQPLPRAYVRRGDARRLPLESDSVDLVITSPPYLNAIDYLRGHRLALVWMGHNVSHLRRLRSTNVGTEVAAKEDVAQRIQRIAEGMTRGAALQANELGMLHRFVSDMDASLSEIARVLQSGGRAVLVVGDSTVGGTFIENSYGVRELAKAAGLRHRSTRRRPLEPNRRYLPPPTSSSGGGQLQARMREEVIIAFDK